MEIVVNSRQTKASDVIDKAFDMGLDRPRIVTVEEWDGSPAFLLTFGPLAYRKTAILRPWMTKQQVEEKLLAAQSEGLAVATREIEALPPHLGIAAAPPNADSVEALKNLMKGKPPQKRKGTKR